MCVSLLANLELRRRELLHSCAEGANNLCSKAVLVTPARHERHARAADQTHRRGLAAPSPA
jgi:hypothetical protein